MDAPDPPDAAPADDDVVQPIDHDDLRVEHLPHSRDPFDDVVRFAATFDGYAVYGMEMCGEMANRAMAQWEQLGAVPTWLEGDLPRLRGCLYFEARRWIRLEREPDTRSLIYVHALIDAVRDALEARDEAADVADPAPDGAAQDAR
ncbi:MAG: hypothetical protein RI554_04435 [Trueperaceae bacterium]|nr:hypothetical protein [Trueperaceae bacterium]